MLENALKHDVNDLLDYKTKLQEVIQADKRKTVEYRQETVQSLGKKDIRSYTVKFKCTNGDSRKGTGSFKFKDHSKILCRT